ncbi:YybH family protein [Rhodococcus sp. ARP2]|uniref:YybH family protein n=1 Tax=Rhodococcus sp. ARP2 TaxID=1661385 RepID=UPI00064C1F13|nr:nuclear transport factor 2 family protein [Rhodococcus sp. ARP2]
MTTTDDVQKAGTPVDIAKLFVQFANAGDADAVAALYEEGAVMAFPPGSLTVGRQAIREVISQMLAAAPSFTVEESLPTVISGDLAMTSTKPSDGTGGRTQVARRQSDGSWLRVLDRPEL